MILEIVAMILILLYSVILHEIAHGYSAYKLGDPTAKYANRLTLNPVSHISFIGTIIVPAVLFLTNASFIAGWANPVPYNPANLRGGRFGEAFVAAAGSLTNFAIAIIFSIASYLVPDTLSTASFELIYFGIFINILLGVINLIPIPPLDGSKVLFAILPNNLAMWYRRYIINPVERLGFVGIIIVIFIFFTFIAGPIFYFILTVTQALYLGQ